MNVNGSGEDEAFARRRFRDDDQRAADETGNAAEARDSAAEQAEERVTTILERITDAFLALDREWRFTYVNRKAHEIIAQVLHHDPGDFIGKSFWEVLPEVVGSRLDVEFHRALAEQQTVTFVAPYPALGLWFEIRAYPSASGLTVYFRDVTRLRETEKERDWLLHWEEGLAAIAEALVRDVGLERVVETIVAQSRQVLGVDYVALWLADPASRTLTLYTAHGFRPDFFEIKQYLSYDASYLASRTARSTQMQVIEDIDAPSVPARDRAFYQHEGLASLVAIPLCARGRLVGVVGYGTRTPHHFPQRERDFLETVADLFAVAIENAELFEQIQQALQLREEFLASAAHALKTPVTVIRGRVQLALRHERLPASLRRDLEVVDRHVEQITRQIEDLLAAVRLRPGAIVIHRAPFDLSATTRRVVDAVASTVEHRRFCVEAATPLGVDSDRPLIDEVITRLLENAIRYSPEDGLIEVAVQRQDGAAVVSVTDHGAGIAPERQAFVFQPFYQPIPAGEPGYVGRSGLGLNLAKQIVDALGGRIWLQSVPGKGATFAFSLPLE